MNPWSAVASADRPDLAGAERAGRRQRPEELVDDPGVVVGDAEQLASPTVAREQQRRRRHRRP